MRMVNILMAVAGTVMVGMMMYYTAKILDHVKGEPEYTLGRFFISEEAAHTFQVMAASVMVFSAAMIYGSLGIVFDTPGLTGLIPLGAATGSVGFLYFLRKIAVTTGAYEGKMDVISSYLGD